MRNPLHKKHTDKRKNTGYQERKLHRDMHKPVSMALDEMDTINNQFLLTRQAATKENIATIYDLMKKVAYRHSNQHAELNKLNEAAFLCFQDILNQLLAEEHDLYPALKINIKDTHKKDRSIHSEKQASTTRLLYKTAHTKALKNLRLFRKITNNYQLPEDACTHYKTLFEKLKNLERELKAHFLLSDKILAQRNLST